MRRLRLGLLLGAAAMAAGCPGGCDPTKLLDVTGVQSISIAPTSAQMVVGQTQQFAATVKPDRFTDDGVTWSVGPAGAATIDTKGLLSAVAPGTVVVKVTTVAAPAHTAEAAVTIIATAAR